MAVGDVVRVEGKEDGKLAWSKPPGAAPYVRRELYIIPPFFIGQSQSGIANSFYICDSRKEAQTVSHNLIFCQVIVLAICFGFWNII